MKWSRRSANPTSESSSAAAPARLAPSVPGDARRQSDVLEAGEIRGHLVELKYETDRSIAQARHGGAGERCHVLIADQNASGIHAIERPEKVQEGRLAGSRGADHRDDLARRDVHADAAQDLHATGTVLVRLEHTLGADRDAHRASATRGDNSAARCAA